MLRVSVPDFLPSLLNFQSLEMFPVFPAFSRFFPIVFLGKTKEGNLEKKSCSIRAAVEG